MKTVISFVIIFSLLSPQLLWAETVQKNRVIILTDIEADPDDTESLVRLLLYSNEIDIKGLIATTSTWQKTKVAPESIEKVVKAYGKVQPNLLKHEAGFPDAKSLASIIKHGLPVYGMQGVGDGKNSQGSDWIVKVLEENDARPLWISVWGGVNTLAQALYEIQHTKTPEEAGRLIAKLRVYTISDQDDSGIWIRNNFPGLFYIVSPGDDYGRSGEAGSVTFSDNHVTLWRWRDDFQNDFAARMAWCTQSYKGANHPPVPVLTQPDHFTVKSGERFTLDASGSTDPDGDSLSYIWFNYPEAGSYKKMINIDGADNTHAVFVVAPEVTQPETAHFILKVTDKGSPPLSRYKRVVVTILPK